jgi:excinuclease ABC subunit B
LYKEGFLRSERSLIQTIGRAARNINGRAILYAAKITKSMKKAIDETERRREKQHSYNVEHGITPKGVFRRITDVMDVGEFTTDKALQNKVAERNNDYSTLSINEIDKKVKELENEMFEHAKNLEFEKAAATRDTINKLREHQLLRG